MLDRRQAMWATAAAVIAPALPAAAKTIGRTLRVRHDLGWPYEICWAQGSHADHHIVDLRVPLPGTPHLTAQARFDYGQIDPFYFDDQLFGAPRGRPHDWPYGFPAFYSTRDETKAQNARNVIDGCARDQAKTSIYLVGWGPRTIYMASEIVPISSALLALPDKAALVIADWRYAARVANVSFRMPPNDVAALMARALYRLPTAKTATFYMADDLLDRMPAQGKHGIVIGQQTWPVRGIKALGHWEETI